MALVIYKGDRSPSLAGSVLVGGAPFDLTGSAVKLQTRKLDSQTLAVDTVANISTGSTLVDGAQDVPINTLAVDSTAGFIPSGWLSVSGLLLSYRSLSDAAFIDVSGADGGLANDAAITQIGGVTYDWAVVDVDEAADFIAWWHITLGSGLIQQSDPFAIDIRDQLGNAANLCDLHDVRLALESEQREVARDTQIESAIVAASDAIMDWSRREFAPATTAPIARRFKLNKNRRTRHSSHINPYRVGLAPYDLRAATTVKLHEGTTDEVTLAAADFNLEPYQKPQGTYTEVEVASSVTLAGDLGANFGFYELHILGDWGFSPIPDAVRRAAVLTSMSWLDIAVAEYATSITLEDVREVQPTPGSSLWIPQAARLLLATYERGTDH